MPSVHGQNIGDNISNQSGDTDLLCDFGEDDSDRRASGYESYATKVKEINDSLNYQDNHEFHQYIGPDCVLTELEKKHYSAPIA